jgi:hypothetical protein
VGENMSTLYPVVRLNASTPSLTSYPSFAAFFFGWFHVGIRVSISVSVRVTVRVRVRVTV